MKTKLLSFVLALCLLATSAIADNQGMRMSGRTGGLGTTDILSSQNVFIPSSAAKANCTTDVTAELEAFLTAHSGYATARSGDCWLLADAGNAIKTTADMNLHCAVADTCTLESNNSDSVISYLIPDATALDSKTLISAIGSGTVNLDDNLQRLTVASTSGYHIGDWVAIRDSVSTPSRVGSTKTVSSVAWDAGNSKCVVTTSTSHGYSASSRVFIKSVVATVGATKVDYIDGSDGMGRTYNITLGDGAGANTSTKFTLQALDNSTDTTTGTDINCDTGTYSSGGTTSTSNGWAGESARVTGIDTVNNYIFLAARLKYVNLYVQSPVLYRWTKARKFSIDGFRIKAKGDTTDLSISTSDVALAIGGVPEAYFGHITGEDLWDALIVRYSDPGSIAENITGYKLPNRSTNDPSGTPKVVTAVTAANPAVFTSTAHGFSNGGNGIFLSGFTGAYTAFNNSVCRVANKTNDTFQCQDTYGNAYDSSAFGGAFSGSAAAGEVADVTGLGYLASDYGSTSNATLRAAKAYEGRHTYTTDGLQTSWSTTLSPTNFSIGRMGNPTYNLVEDAACYDAIGPCIDEHEEDASLLVKNFSVFFAHRGPQFGSYQSRGGQFRGKDTTIDGYYQFGGTGGIVVRATEHDSVSVNNFNNILIENTEAAGTTISSSCSGSSTAYDMGLMFCSSAANTNIPINHVTNYRTRNVSFPIMAWQKSKVSVDGGVFRDFQSVSENFAGAQLTMRNIVASESTNTHTAAYNYIVGLRSDGVNDTGNKATIQGLKIVKGTNADYPRHIFDEKDATATKNFYISGLEEENSSAVTGSALLESGSTTVSWLSTIAPAQSVHEKCIALSDQATTISAATGLGTVYLPAAAHIVGVRAYAATAPTGVMTIDINEAGTTIMASTKLTIDANEFNGGSANMQGTAATAAVVSDAEIAANAAISFDVDSTTGGKGLVGCISAIY